MGHFDYPSQKIMIYFDIPQILGIFYRYGTMVVLFQEISGMHILPHLIAKYNFYDCYYFYE
jgi:hypothetical protein